MLKAVGGYGRYKRGECRNEQFRERGNKCPKSGRGVLKPLPENETAARFIVCRRGGNTLIRLIFVIFPL